MIVRENGVNNFYFTYTDYLGSILTVTDRNGNTVAEQNFDAWGRNRNPDTWDYNAVSTTPVWLYRGYTGHEHLPQFELINMNGRLYDPVQGRMLSPDNYVAAPFGTQGYNRYSYANNNPLVYADPDGNFIIPIIAAAIIGATTSSAVYAITSGSSFSWSGLGRTALLGAVGGAISGGFSVLGTSLGTFGQSLGTTLCPIWQVQLVQMWLLAMLLPLELC